MRVICGIIGIMLFCMCAVNHSVSAQDTCTGLMPLRLMVGQQGRVTPGEANLIRSQPSKSSEVIGKLPAGMLFKVLEGPKCGSQLYWWKVDYEGVIGWTGEGAKGVYWIEPVITVTATPLVTAIPTPVSCPGLMLSRLRIGKKAQVTPGEANTMRSEPARSSQKLGSIKPGKPFTVLAGPVCADEMAWWQVDYNGLIGWTVEGEGNTYWLEPLSGIKQEQIVFESGRDGNREIYIMNPDGSDQRNLTNNSVDDGIPSVSPDGKQIVFWSAHGWNYEIHVMNSDGSNQRNLTNNPAQDYAPDWSPDGKQIVFQSGGDGNSEIYVMNADGSNQRNLTNNPAWDTSPDWSPDGKQIVFETDRDGNSEIYVMNVDGSNQRNLTNKRGSDYSPAWSPDGQQIAFSSTRDSNPGIYIMNADGSNPHRLTNQLNDHAPAWSPDGQQIAFHSLRNGIADIYVIRTDGSNLRKLTNISDWNGSPNWAWVSTD